MARFMTDCNWKQTDVPDCLYFWWFFFFFQNIKNTNNFCDICAFACWCAKQSKKSDCFFHLFASRLVSIRNWKTFFSWALSCFLRQCLTTVKEKLSRARLKFLRVRNTRTNLSKLNQKRKRKKITNAETTKQRQGEKKYYRILAVDCHSW